MSKRLVIAEKPSVARDIAAALGPAEPQEKGAWFETDDYVISYAVGHLLELDDPESYDKKWRSWTLKHLPIVPEAFTLSPRDTKAEKRLRVLRKLAKRQDVVGLVNACDAGREGELIFRTVAAALGPDLSSERLWLSSLTTDAIRNGFLELKPSAEYDSLADAAYSRSEADWLIGINATRALSRRLRSLGYEGAWTAGRVQTPTLTMLVDREIEIYLHRARPYWRLSATFDAGDHRYEGRYFDPKADRAEDKEHLPDRVFDPERIKELAEILKSAPRIEAKETRSQRRERAPLPFDLTTLQRVANDRLSFSAKRTLDAAQRLYEEHKLISYPRTDSRCLPGNQRTQLKGVLDALAGVPAVAPVVAHIRQVGVQNTSRVFDDSRVTDHYAIMPIAAPGAHQLSGDDARVYDLISRHFLAAFMAPAVWAEVKRETVAHGREQLRFRTSERVLEEPGWRMATSRNGNGSRKLLPLDPAEGAAVSLTAQEVEEKVTQPPPRLTESVLLNRMENCGKEVDDTDLAEALHERGLGTPATRADTIERLIAKGYIARMGKSLRATAKAIRLVEVLRSAGADTLTSVELTGEMEAQLRHVSAARQPRTSFMDRVKDQTVDLTETLKTFEFERIYGANQDLGACPSGCGGRVRETAWGYECTTEECPDSLFIWKDVRGHVLLHGEMSALLSDGDLQTGPVPLFPPAFRGKGRGSYMAHLRLRRLTDKELAARPNKSKRPPSRWRLDALPVGQEDTPANGEDSSAPEVRVADLCACPSRDGALIVETDRRYVDSDHVGSDERPQATLPKEVCGRAITREEATTFFQSGKTELLENFISKRNRPFKAKLVLKDNGRHGFEFEPRKSNAKRARKRA